jgi:hypothetical protein
MSGLPAISEKEFMRQVSDLARIFGWRVYHPWLSIHSERGWPDVAICKPPRLILAELKTERGKTTPHQDEWLAMLAACPGVETYLWRPSDLDGIARCLGA